MGSGEWCVQLGRMKLRLYSDKSSRSTNQVVNTVHSSNGVDIVSFFPPCGIRSSRWHSRIICLWTCWDTAGASIQGNQNIRTTRPWKWEHVGKKCNKYLTILEGKTFLDHAKGILRHFYTYGTNKWPRKLLHLSRAFLHETHRVFPPPQVSGHNGQDPIYKNKME